MLLLLCSQGVSKAVYRGVLDLLKYLLHSVEEDFAKELEAPLFSAFLIFRLAFSVYHEPQTKSTLGFSLRSALSISTSLMATESVKEPSSPLDSPSQVCTTSVSQFRVDSEFMLKQCLLWEHNICAFNLFIVERFS